ncbi:hypothetical protein MMC17_005910 [Xylographa soralifera]|nr:hypothetical protein [Xylographa soralifera]
MIEGKEALPLGFRRLRQRWKRSSEAPVRRVNSELPVIRVVYPKDEPPPKRVPIDKGDIFGLLQDIQADIFSPSNDLPAKNSYDGTTKALSGLSALESLPLSPLMHPQLLAARRRHTKAKPLPSKDLTQFQSLLEKNPYAKILASPVRSCILTGVRLPCSLFLPLTIQNHPRTRKPWLVPQGLGYLAVPGTGSETTPPMPPRSYRNAVNPTHSDLGSHTSIKQQTASPPSKPTPIRSVHSFVPSSPSPTLLPSVSSTAYITTQLSALDHIAASKPRFLHRILPFRWKTHLGTSLQSTVCRDDLSDFVLSRLRERLIQRLLTLADGDDPYFIAYSKVVNGGPYHMGAVLWVGLPREGQEDSGEGEAESYMTVRVPGTNRMVPIYNLRALLGMDGLQKLDSRRGGFWRGKEMMGVKARGKALELLAELWRLMVYFGGEEKGLREWKMGAGGSEMEFEDCEWDGEDV